MANTFNEAIEYISGSKTFDLVGDIDDLAADGSVKVIGSIWDDELTLKSLEKKHKNDSPDDFTIYYDGGNGEDTLDYTVASGTSIFDEEGTNPVWVQASTDSVWQYEINHGDGNYGNDYLLGDLKVYTRAVEVFDLTQYGDQVDLQSATGGTDEFHGDGGNDTMRGSNYNDHLEGGNDDDYIDGNGGNDHLVGDKGNDTIYGGAGNDYISGGSNSDTIHGGGNNDTIDGGEGNEIIYGNNGHDSIRGGDDDDTIFGGNGYDTISGGDGNDSLTGNAHVDTFMFDMADGTDTITDFSGDEIYLFSSNGNDFSLITDANSSNTATLHFGSTDIILTEMGGLSMSDIDVATDSGGATLTWDEDAGNQGTEDDTVICTYMHERRYIADAVFKWDGVYGRQLGAEVLAGYHAWAIPLVENVLRRSELATWLVRPLACAWALEMAHSCDPVSHPKGAVLGRILLTIGVPVCGMIGRLLSGQVARAPG